MYVNSYLAHNFDNKLQFFLQIWRHYEESDLTDSRSTTMMVTKLLCYVFHAQIQKVLPEWV